MDQQLRIPFLLEGRHSGRFDDETSLLLSRPSILLPVLKALIETSPPSRLAVPLAAARQDADLRRARRGAVLLQTLAPSLHAVTALISSQGGPKQGGQNEQEAQQEAHLKMFTRALRRVT